MSNQKGITLIALVITIIILLILTGITIFSLTSENGIFKKGMTASEETNNQTATEIMNLKITNIQIQSYSDTQALPTLQYLSNKLCEDDEIEYVDLSSKISSLKPIQIEDGTSSIFTKLKEFPYEFEINGSLQLASINGEKLPNTNSCDHISDLIPDFSPIVKEVNGTYITLDVPENIIETAIGYVYLLNNKVVSVGNATQYSYMNLDLNTNYELSVIAIDVNGKLKSSTIMQTTLDKLYLYVDGIECTPITGGWNATGYHVSNSGTFTKNTNNMYLYAPYNSRIFIGIKNAIDLSSYSKLFIESTGSQYFCQISTNSYFNNSRWTRYIL